PYLSELQPEMYCEVSPELAAEVGLEPYGWATLISARSAIEAKVLVTERMKPLRVGERTVHQIGLPFHWGRGTEAKGRPIWCTVRSPTRSGFIRSVTSTFA